MWKNKKKFNIIEEGLYILAVRLEERILFNIEFRFFKDADIMSWTTLIEDFKYFTCNKFIENKDNFLNSKYLLMTNDGEIETTIEDIETTRNGSIINYSNETGVFALMSEGKMVNLIVKDEAIYYLRIPIEKNIFHDIIPNDNIVSISHHKRLNIFKRDKFKCKKCEKIPSE